MRVSSARQRLSVLIVTDPHSASSDGAEQGLVDAQAIAQALTAQGMLVLGVREGDAWLPEVVARMKPDVIVVRSDAAVRDVLEHIAVATQHERKPIALFTEQEDRGTMREAMLVGVSAYVVKGLAAERVQSVIDVAVERFAADEALRRELADTKSALADRELIARAKRLIMQRKRLSEPEAHKLLQSLAMDRGLKLREAAQRVIDLESLLG
jgi:two-component system, response regulator / RNA-binding antiterminator